VAAFGVLGAYMRLVLIAATPPGFASYLTSQFVGSFILGAVDAVRDGLPDSLHVGIATGLCGSLTTFSTWQVDVAKDAVGFPGGPPTPSGKAYSWFANQLIGLAVPLAGIDLGRDAGVALHGALIPVRPGEPPAPAEKRTAVGRTSAPRQEAAAATLAALVLAGVAIGCGLATDEVSISLVFAPFGAMTRFLIALELNAVRGDFFVGTFAANVGGSILAAGVLIALAEYDLAPLSCGALTAVQDGFCGALTTVSTFVKEIRLLGTKASYVYGLVTVAVTQVALLVMLGAYVSSVAGAFASPTCLVPAPASTPQPSRAPPAPAP